MTGHGWSPWGDVGNTSYPIVFNLTEISESTILSEEENRLVLTCTGKLVPTWSTAEEATCLDKAHTPDTSKELCVSLSHTRHNQMAAKEAGGRLRELPLGDPCRPGYMEAGWLLEGERTWVSCGDTGLRCKWAGKPGGKDPRSSVMSWGTMQGY